MLYASSETWSLFFNGFARDSYDNAGALYDSIFDRGYSCPNASWNGSFISFCPGTTTDDVTAHELGHAYTTYTHGLIYAWQPGALNESYSDIWGETLDQLNGRAPTPQHAPHGRDLLRLLLRALPHPIHGQLAGQHRGRQVGGLRLLRARLRHHRRDGRHRTHHAANGCTAITEDLTGKIALVDRGTCTFAVKAANAQAKGASAVVIANNTGTAVLVMSGFDSTITVPVTSVSLPTRNAIVGEIGLGNPVNVTVRRQGRGRHRRFLSLADGRGRLGVRWRHPRHVGAALLLEPGLRE